MPGRTRSSSSARRARTGNVLPAIVAAAPTSVTVASNQRPGIASKRTSTVEPWSTSAMRRSGTDTSTSGRLPELRITTGAPARRFSFTSASTPTMAPAIGARRRV